MKKLISAVMAALILMLALASNAFAAIADEGLVELASTAAPSALILSPRVGEKPGEYLIEVQVRSVPNLNYVILQMKLPGTFTVQGIQADGERTDSPFIQVPGGNLTISMITWNPEEATYHLKWYRVFDPATTVEDDTTVATLVLTAPEALSTPQTVTVTVAEAVANSRIVSGIEPDSVTLYPATPMLFAEENGDSIIIDVKGLYAPSRLLLWGYTQDGRFVGLRSLYLTERMLRTGSSHIILPIVTGSDTHKVAIVDANYRPLVEAVQVTLPAPQAPTTGE